MGNMKTSLSHEPVCIRINEFRKTGKFCDVKLIVEGDVFPAHKTLLAGFSPFFEGMFSNNFVESKQDSVKLESIDVSIMENLLQFAYTGEIDLTSENVRGLLHASNFLQAGELFGVCCKYLMMNINTESCVAIYNISEVYSCKELHEKAKQFILENFANVCAEVDFLELEAEKLMELITDSGLRVEKEEFVFDAVLQWFHYKQEEREAVLSEVISHVRLTDLDPYFLHTRLKTTDALMKSDSCQKLFFEVFSYQSLPNRRTEIQSSLFKQRNSAPIVEVLAVTGNLKSSNKKTNMFVAEDGHVIKNFEFPHGCDLSTVGTTSKNKLFCLSSRIVVLYDYKRNVWHHHPFSTAVPSGKAVQNFDGRWYRFGLLESDREIQYLDKSVSEEKWTTIPSMPEEVYNAGVVSIDGLIYIVGGKTADKTPSTRLQRYDPFNKSWSIVSLLPAPWKLLKVCALNGHIYVYNSPDDSEYETWQLHVYNVSSNQWKSCSMLPKTFENHSVLKTVAFKGNIFVLVEKDSNHDIQIYNPQNDSWCNFHLHFPDALVGADDFELCTFRGPTFIERTESNRSN